MKKILVAATGIYLGAFSMASHAVIDLTAVTTAFTDLGVAQVAVGGLLLVAAVTAVTYKWLKGMLFG